MTKSYFAIIGVGVLIAIGALALFFIPAEKVNDVGTPNPMLENNPENADWSQTQPAPPPTPSAVTPPGGAKKPSGSQGRILFTLSDAAVAMDTLDSILMAVNEVSVHSPGTGWVTVLKIPKQVDLLKLYRENKSVILSDTYLNAGSYSQIRLLIGTIAVTPRGSAPEAGIEAKLPSKEIKIVGKLEVAKGQTSAVEFDFMADKSLHKTGNGKYIFAPVVKIDTKSDVDNVQITQNTIIKDKTVEIFGGLQKFTAIFGMDETGELKQNFSFGPYANLELDGDKIKIISQ